MTDATDPAPDIAICAHANLRRAMRAVDQIYDAALRPAGVKGTQFTLLGMVAGEDGLPMTRLAAQMALDRTTLTRNLRPLIDKGWIEIGRSDQDERVRTVHATQAGLRKFDEAAPYWREAQRRITGRIGADGLSGLLAGLAEITAENRDG